MKAVNQLRLLKIYARRCGWSYNGTTRQFTATYAGRGMKVTLRPEAKRHDIAKMASEVERELVQADKGELDAETEELWSRETGKRLDS